MLFDTGLPKVTDTYCKLGFKSTFKNYPLWFWEHRIFRFWKWSRLIVYLPTKEKIPLKAILCIEDYHGNILYDNAHKGGSSSKKVVDPYSVRELNGMLQLVTKEDTGRSLYDQYRIDFPIVGKTGTTQNQCDGWFIGYNKHLVIGAWIVANDRRIHFRNLATGSGGRTVLPLVGSLFEYAGSNGRLKNKSFRRYELGYLFG